MADRPSMLSRLASAISARVLPAAATPSIVPAMNFTSTPAPRARRGDSYVNVLTGLGVAGKDKRVATSFIVDPVTDEEARALWRGDDIAARAIEIVPGEAFRKGFAIKIPDDKELSEEISTYLEDLKHLARLTKAAEFERAYGGGALFPVINDGTGDMRQPLNLDRVNTIKAIHAFEPRELQVASWFDSIGDVEYREPKTYRLQPVGGRGAQVAGLEVHRSRLIIFPGIRVSSDTSEMLRPGWGDSVLTRAKQVMADFGTGFGSASALLQELAQGIYSMKGLAEVMGEDNGDQLVMRRLQLFDLMKSTLNTAVVDSEDKYERQSTPLSGGPEMLDRLIVRLAAAIDLPVTVMMGVSPAGLNATGESDIRLLYDRVNRVQTTRYQDPVEQLVRLAMHAKDGPSDGVEPDVWSIEWLSLWQQSDKEREEARFLRTQNDAVLIDKQIASADEIRTQRYGGDTYSYELQLTGEFDVQPTPADMAALVAARKLAAGVTDPNAVDNVDPNAVDGGGNAKVTADAADDTGVMVALRLPRNVARTMSLPDGIPVEEMHITLAYLGKNLDPDTLSRIDAAVQQWAQVETWPIVAMLGGIGRFSASETSDGMDVVYLSVDSHELVQARQDLVSVLQANDVWPSTDHGFTPHVTLAYVDPSAPSPIDRIEPIAVSFDAPYLVVGPEWLPVPVPVVNHDHIAHEGGEWVVYSNDRTKVLGRFSTKAEATAYLANVEAHK